MRSSIKQSSKKHPKQYVAHINRLNDYKIKLQQTRQIMNDVIREAVYRDAQCEINEQYEKQRITQLKQQINLLKEQNLDLRQRVDYYQGFKDERPSIIYMDFSLIDGHLQLNSAYQNEPRNQIVIQAPQNNGKQTKQCFAIDISWI